MAMGNRPEEKTPLERGQEDAAIVIEYMAGVVHTLAQFFGEYQSGYSDTPAPEEPPEDDGVKTCIGDCRCCWCDSCANIEQCDIVNVEDTEPDGLRPNPCIGCLDGMRGMPKENKPACGAYVEFDGHNNG